MNEFKPYAKALFALKDLNKTKLGRILRPMTGTRRIGVIVISDPSIFQSELAHRPVHY